MSYWNGNIARIVYGSNEIAKAYMGSDLVFQKEEPETMTLIRHWDGTSAPSSSRWYDKIANQYWTLTNATHGTNYYQFLNTNPASSTQRGALNGSLPDLGYHWKMVIDCEIRMQASNPRVFTVVDFGSIGSVADNKCAVYCGLSSSNGEWGIGPKFNGNTSATTYNYDNSTLTAETITTATTWLRRTVTFGVRSSSTTGMDETFISIPGIGEAVSATPYTPIRFNRWESGVSYIARGRVNPSSTYKYSTSCRIYDLKIYYEPIS